MDEAVEQALPIGSRWLFVDYQDIAGAGWARSLSNEALDSAEHLHTVEMERFKFGHLAPNGADSVYHYPDVYDWERTTGPSRLVIAPSVRHVDLLIALTTCWRGPFGLLYVLNVPRGDASAGRYQSPAPL